MPFKSEQRAYTVEVTMHQINVSVVYATAQKQWLEERQVARGTNAKELIAMSQFLDQIDSLQGKSVDDLNLGVYSQKVGSDYLLEEGDRLEIYRELTADPKEVRRQLAKLGKTMGSKA